MRMMRDSPPELDRLLPGPNISTSRTRRPDRRKCNAVQAPKTPAPTTTASKLIRLRPAGLPTRTWECSDSRYDLFLAIFAASRRHESRTRPILQDCTCERRRHSVPCPLDDD